MIDATKRYWVSWYSGNYADEGCTRPPYTTWITGSAERQRGAGNADADADADAERDDLTFCAVIDAASADDVWARVGRHFPDFRQRFCDEKAADFAPGERFR